jgi:hypothetical protein
MVRSTGLTRPRRLRIRSSGGLMSLGAGAKFNASARLPASRALNAARELAGERLGAGTGSRRLSGPGR